MSPSTKLNFNISVRKLVEFICRTGDLASSTDNESYLPPDAATGQATHQKLQQQARDQQKSEVSVQSSFSNNDVTVKLRGRIDLAYREHDEWVIEEIKTTYRDLAQGQSIIPEAQIKLHQAQAKIYAYLFLQSNGDGTETEEPTQATLHHCLIRLTYCNPETNRLLSIEERQTEEQLSKFYHLSTEQFLRWLTLFKEQINRRDAFVQSLEFPFSEYRDHQRKLSEYVYLALKKKDTLLVEAPTGLGKSIASLFPAIKNTPTKNHQPILVLTAKNSGRHSFLTALEHCQKSNTKAAQNEEKRLFRAIELQAKEKVCPCIVGKTESDLNDNCSRCEGFYDRLTPAMEEALVSPKLDQEELQRLAEVHHLCPHQLAMEMVPWTDLIIGDFNYGFDLQSSQLDKITSWGFNTSLIVDEAHNLVDRARDNYSAEFSTEALQCLQQLGAETNALANLAESCDRINNRIRTLGGNPLPIAINKNSPEPWQKAVAEIVDLLHLICQEFEQGQNEINSLEQSSDLLQIYFSVKKFLDTFENLYQAFPDHYSIFLESIDRDNNSFNTPFKRSANNFQTNSNATSTDLFHNNEEEIFQLRINNFNPAPILERYLKKSSGTVLLSATLSPTSYFSALLTNQESTTYTRFPSPFPAENVFISVPSYLSTHYRARDTSMNDLVEIIKASFATREGNYIVCFPSFEYMDKVFATVEEKYPKLPLQKQSRVMTEKQRKAFLEKLNISSQPIISFVILGGIFAESVDYIGEKLIGAIIVTLGLPSPTFERKQLSNYFDAEFSSNNGFAMAYQIPGIIRVLQSAGRVIRSQKDRGIITLVDTRFLNSEYHQLLPDYWSVNRIQSLAEYQQKLAAFWEDQSSLFS